MKQRKVNKNKFFQHRYCFRFHNSREYSRHDTRAKQELRFNKSLSKQLQLKREKKENRVKHIKRALKATKRGEEDKKRQQAKTKTERERDDY